MKHKEGDVVRIKSQKWYDSKKNNWGAIEHEDFDFVFSMEEYCGKIAKITFIDTTYNAYLLDIDNGDNFWADWMFAKTPERKH